MVKIVTEYITLGQLLKMTSWVDSGGQAKVIIKQLDIKVNGVKDNRRGRKLYVGDEVMIEDKTYKIDR